MSIRKRDDSVKSGCGVDGSLGEDFTRRRTSPWSPPKMGGEDINPRGAGRYTDDSPGLRNTLPYESNSATNKTYDVFDEVEGQSSDSGNRAVRSRGQP